MKRYITCLDIETTGLDKNYDRIIQLAVVKFDVTTGERLLEKSWYIKPSGFYKISESAQAIHNITQEIVETQGVPLKSIYQEFMDIKEDTAILSYNGMTFDMSFIQKEFERELLDPKFYEHEFIDSYDIERRSHSNKLIDTYTRYYGKPFEDAHDAFSDVQATIDVFLAQLKNINPEIIKESCDVVTKNCTTSPEGFVKYNDKGELIFAVGKYKEITTNTVCKTDPGYIKWLFSPNNGNNVITIPTKKSIKREWENK